jgi:1-acyl-sn-glycerol-3-phosphate acyltransferase
LWLRLRFVQQESRAFTMVRDCAQSVLRLSGCRVRVLHPEHVATHDSVMLVSNHVSLADAAVLLAALPLDFRFVAGHAYAEIPLLGAAIRGASANIVNRSSWRSRANSGKAMVDALAGGQSLLVFPEGTTADDGNMLPFRNGAFRAAARTGRPVVPIAIRGTREMFPHGSMRLSNVPVEIEILPPILPVGDTRDAVIDLRDRAAAAIRARL